MLKKIYSLIFVFIALTTVGQWLSINWWAPNLTVGFMEWCLFFGILIYPVFGYGHFIQLKRYKSYSFFNLFVIYTAFLSIYALVKYSTLGSLSDFASMVSYIFAMLSCLCVYTLSLPNWFRLASRRLYICLPYILIAYMPFAKDHAYGDLIGFLCLPSVLLLLFIRDLSIKHRTIWVIISILIIITSFYGGARSNVIKYGVALFLGFTSKIIFFNNVVKHCVWSFFLLPLIFFTLGITHIFNIFETDKFVDSESLNESTIEDTRTLVYNEALVSAINNEYVWFGRGIGKGYESIFQQRRMETSGDMNITEINASERQAEVGILNIFTWGGVAYVVLYTIFCIYVVYWGLYVSNNSFVKVTAVYFAFYYMYSWIENFQNFTIMFISSWFMVALCISPYFRKMSNLEFKIYWHKLLN